MQYLVTPSSWDFQGGDLLPQLFPGDCLPRKLKLCESFCWYGCHLFCRYERARKHHDDGFKYLKPNPKKNVTNHVKKNKVNTCWFLSKHKIKWYRLPEYFSKILYFYHSTYGVLGSSFPAACDQFQFQFNPLLNSVTKVRQNTVPNTSINWNI